MKNYMQNDVVSIRVQFLAKTGKSPITMRFIEPMIRYQASEIADSIESNPDVFRAECQTDRGMVF